ncbi:Formin-like protein 16, partial [Mucuna pruriens]
MSVPFQAIAIAVAATAAAMLLFGVMFFYFQKFVLSGCHHRHKVETSFLREAQVDLEDIKKVGGNMKGLLVEENGIDILYMMETEGRQFKTRFPNRRYNPSYEDEEEKGTDIMVQRSKRIKPQEVTDSLLCETPGPGLIDHENLVKPLSQVSSLPCSVSASLPPTQHQPPLPLPSLPQTSLLILEKKTLPPPPPPPPPPAPPSFPPRMKVPKAPPLLSSPIMNREGVVSPPKTSGFISLLKPPLPPKEKANIENTTEAMIGESSRGNGANQTRLKPLYWDKVVANVDHSTVWDQISDGSLFDYELMETLFGYSTNNQIHEKNRCLSTSAKSNTTTPTQLFILDPRKSQNIAIVLRSLAISRKGILDAVHDGQGLSAETLERLTKIAPTQEEEAKITQFSGIPDKLADAESFLYHILREVPTAFIRLKALLFRSSYGCEVIQLKEHLKTLEMGCNEMKTSGLLLKFLEAILKAGNRMNAGTSRGNAHGFNLSALKKLSDVKSTDGKTSLLHFIAEQVAQFEGRQQANNQKQGSIGETSNTSGTYSDNPIQQEAFKEYLMLGLPVLGGLRDELYEVKKAASIEHQNFVSMYSTLNAYVTEIRQIVTSCGKSERGGFIKVMKGFVEECEVELKVVREEQTRVMELVKKTNEYYLTGVSKENTSNPFQLFVTVKEFVDMVDEVCIELRRKLEAVSTPPLSPLKRVPLRFPNFDLHFLPSMSGATYSSQSEDDF